MQPLEEQTRALPAAVAEPLQQFCQTLQSAVADQLISVMIYGGLARGEYTHGRSDVNVLLVLKEATLPVLDGVLRALGPCRLKIPLALMTLAEADLTHAADVFAIKFLDIQRHHLVLVGRDVCPEMNVTPERLRRQCLRELMNLQMRLRRFYLQRSTRPELIENTLAEMLPAFLSTLAVLVELKTGAVPATRADTLSAAAALGVVPGVFQQLLALKRGELKPGAAELRQLYAGFLDGVRAACKLAGAGE